MPTWVIEPRDPLIVRDSRRFGASPAVRAVAVPFPLPSTTTGGARNRAGLDANGVFDRSRIDAVKQLAVRGPFLIELAGDGLATEAEVRWLLPAPADALVLGGDGPLDDDPLRLRPLVPLAPSPGASTNLPTDLQLVGQPVADRGKPSRRAPHFWFWSRYAEWLAAAAEQAIEADTLGLGGLPVEARTHVSLDPATGTAAESLLFQTPGLVFTGPARRRLALAVLMEAELPHFGGGLAPLGGQRRLMSWRRCEAAPPACPPAVRDAIARHGACRVLLVTPACFKLGFRPAWLIEPRHGVTPRLVGAAIPRAQAASGWDMAQRAPKPTRRLAPAGSVYFLQLDGTPASRTAWLDQHWFQAVSDEPQDRLDGFGLAALGAWSGQLAPMGAPR